MNRDSKHLKQWIHDLADLIEKNAEPDPHYYRPFLQDPNLALHLVEFIETLEDRELEQGYNYYACIFALDLCVVQLQAAQENGSKAASKTLNLLMAKMAQAINKGKQTLNFWLPILNAFYEVHLELSAELRQSYLDLAEQEESPMDEVGHLNIMRELIADSSDLSIFEIAENFFAQAYAMPADFFADLILDLYSIDEGQDIALLALLHPKQEVREVVVETLEELMDKITLSSISLSRLRLIKKWYPPSYQDQFQGWITMQRKKGVVFSKKNAKPSLQIKASEIDGSGAQVIFIHIQQKKNARLCGLLLKQGQGIKDAWVTSLISPLEVPKYYEEADSLSLRAVDEAYLLMMVKHFLALTLNQRLMPDLHLLEIQELTGIEFYPELLDLPYLIDSLSVRISPFTSETMQAALKRSKKWAKTKGFIACWFIENAHVDKLVNRYCSFVDGAKVCSLEKAMASVFLNELEKQRDKWLFHFLWTALWAQSKAAKNEIFGRDCFFVAYAIHVGQPLETLPIMQEVCRQTVLNSIETMQERRTHLT